MSLYDYQISREISGKDYPFYSLIMAAMRQADSSNIEKLKYMFPEVHAELSERYNSPGGVLSRERKKETKDDDNFHFNEPDRLLPDEDELEEPLNSHLELEE